MDDNISVQGERIHSFIQQIFVHILCTRHYYRHWDTAGNNTPMIIALFVLSEQLGLLYLLTYTLIL